VRVLGEAGVRLFEDGSVGVREFDRLKQGWWPGLATV
jgi:hypothetical protein